MSRRRHGSKPAFALWMLVAVADVALLAASAGLFVLLLMVAAVVTAAGAVLAVRLSHRYDVVARLVRLQRRNSAAHSWLLRHATAHDWLVRPVAGRRRPGRMTYARRRA
jgi:hypothetical protein